MKEDKERQSVRVGGCGCNPHFEGSTPSSASKHLEEIAKQLKRIADLYEQEIQVIKVKQRR